MFKVEYSMFNAFVEVIVFHLVEFELHSIKYDNDY